MNNPKFAGKILVLCRIFAKFWYFVGIFAKFWYFVGDLSIVGKLSTRRKIVVVVDVLFWGRE